MKNTELLMEQETNAIPNPNRDGVHFTDPDRRISSQSKVAMDETSGFTQNMSILFVWEFI